ncbi:MAG: hypothetical protein Q7S40_24145 [Opitutaceae bacterium]|nr:hypothetical protein [Opitutaceae bacterium]
MVTGANGRCYPQFLSRIREYNDKREKRGLPEVGAGDFLCSPHFLEATAENWQSEFLAIGLH